MANSNIDAWFSTVRQKYASHMQCGKGCTACCHGLFDISLEDAVQVARGYRQLSEDTQQQVYARASVLQQGILAHRPPALPTLLAEDDARIDAIVNAANSPPCPCLGDGGECLIYDFRPVSCRLEGVPMVDTRDGLFSDWCELNFVDGVPEAALDDLEQDYDAINAAEETRSAEVAKSAGIRDHRAVTFIPSVIAEYEEFWKILSGQKMGS
jgi:Fe-S-cluster containining protein